MLRLRGIALAAAAGGALALAAPAGAATGIAADTGAVVFPTAQTIGSVSPPQVVTVTNGGSSSASVLGAQATADAADFLVDSTACLYANPLSPGEACQILVRFAPQVAGPRAGVLSLTTPDGVQSITLAGTGAAAVAPAAQLAIVIGAGRYGVTAGHVLSVVYAASASATVTWELLHRGKLVRRGSKAAHAGRNLLKLAPHTAGHYTLRIRATAAGGTASDKVPLTVHARPGRHRSSTLLPPPTTGSPVGGGGTD